MGQTFYRKTTKNEMEQAFRYFDKDDSGFISVTLEKIIISYAKTT